MLLIGGFMVGRRGGPGNRIYELEVRSSRLRSLVILSTASMVFMNVMMLFIVPGETMAELARGGSLGLAFLIPITILGALGLQIVTGILWCRWTGFAYGNLSSCFGESTDGTPGLAAWSHLIPVAHLWLPFKYTRELVLKSASPEFDVDDTDVVLWWFFWVAHLLRSYVELYVRPQGLTPFHLAFEAVDVLLSLIAAFFALVVIRGITSTQRERFEQERTSPPRWTGR